MTALVMDERQALEDVDKALSRVQQSLEEAARTGALDDEALQRLSGTVKEMAGRLNASLPLQVDVQAADEIRRRLLSLVTGEPEGSHLDVADHVLIELEAVRHILRDVLQEQPPVEMRDAGRLIKLLEEWLPTATVAQLAELLGLSERALQRRRRDGGSATHRMQLAARAIAVLRHAWTDQGVVAWFHRARPDLAGTRPIELLDDPGSERALLNAARAGRVQGGV